MTPSIRVVKGSAGHILAEAFLFGEQWVEWCKERELRGKIRRRRASSSPRQPRPTKYRRTNLLTALLHVKMDKALSHPGKRKQKGHRRARFAAACFPGGTP